MKLYLLLFLLVTIPFRLGRLFLSVRRAHQQGRGTVAAKPMFWIMTVGFVIYLAACAVESLFYSHPFSWVVSIGGLLLYAAALLLRERAMIDLGRYFSPDIEIRDRHQVVRAGFYRFVRHPLLVCMAFEVMGVGLVFNAYGSLMWLGLGLYGPLLYVRKVLEEKKLVASLGNAYQVYQHEVGAFWPKWQTLFQEREKSHV